MSATASCSGEHHTAPSEPDSHEVSNDGDEPVETALVTVSTEVGDPVQRLTDDVLQRIFKGQMRKNFGRFMGVRKAWQMFFLRPGPLWEDFWLQLMLTEPTDERISCLRWLDENEQEPIVRSFKNLHLYLDHANRRALSSEPWPTLSSILRKCELRSLSVEDSTSSYDPGRVLTEDLLSSLGGLSSLECLSITGWEAPQVDVREAFRPLTRLTRLEELFLRSGLGKYPDLYETLSSMTKLRRLALRGSSRDLPDVAQADLLGHSGAPRRLGFSAFTELEALEASLEGALVASMAGLTKLTTLVLRSTRACWELSEEVMARLELPASLVELQLRCRRVPPGLAKCTALRRLELFSAHFTSDEMNLMLRKLTRLEQLRYYRQHGVKFLPPLSDLPNFRVLVDLSVRAPNLDQEGLQRFWAQTSQLQVLALRWLDCTPRGLAHATSLEALYMGGERDDQYLNMEVLARLPRLRLVATSSTPHFWPDIEGRHTMLKVLGGSTWHYAAIAGLCVRPSKRYQS